MISSLIRSDLQNFQPYRSARSLYGKGMFMDANENSFGSAVENGVDQELNRYPDPYSTDLRNALARFVDVTPDTIFVANGSDEAIDLLIRLFVERDEEILIVEPTYGVYRVAANIAGVKVAGFSLSADFSLEMSSLLARVTPKTKMIFCCSPNNPTGTLLKSQDVETICKSFKGIVVVDEAYIEFASRASFVKVTKEIENLVVLRTFSKAWGLAGIRVGYCVANEVVVEYLNKIKPPYNLNRISAKIALEALRNPSKMLDMKAAILTERARLAKALADLGFTVYPSEANFLLARYPGVGTPAKRLAEEFGIIIRDFSTQPLLKGCVRISVGTSEQDDLLIKSLKKIL
ncbi:histidinol-phosphate transaminase [Candidatus Kaiserbacteria bacterium RIFCSPHIGHO2_01_FULL_53_29]|uniref:Histidinol-phosphate aminotransferase n=1 Tax=Candidatus Kaiserbacteria bacterium RIFCSPHIGHO2_01_FULL_53_29 TaxID=1798480 RepID=A0A1F6CW62_9BACT|nr:MAG: histidinol-phosphate transaminase [Candidatus Kaiserbacteria bacterium RIFCSPHIGHO2_01_FULL_53_29]